MADHEFTIKIATVPELAGAQQTSQSLRDLSNQTSKLGAQQADTAKQTEKLEISHHALHKIMHLLGESTTPELGQALMGAFYGPIGGVIALGAAVAFVSRKLEEAHEKAERTAEAVKEAVTQSLEEARDRADELAREMDKASKAADPVKTKYDAGLKILDAQIAAHKKIIEALEKEGAVPAGTAAAFEKTTEQKRLDLQKSELFQREFDRDKLRAREEAADDALRHAQQQLVEAQKKTEGQKAPDLVTLQSARASIDALGGMEAAKAAAKAFPTEFGTSSIEANIAIVEQGEAFEKNAQAIRDQTAKVKDLTEKQKTAADALAANERAITEGKQTLKTGTTVMRTGQVGDLMQQAIEIAKRGGPQNQAEAQLEQMVATIVAGRGVSVQTAQAMLQKAAGDSRILDIFIGRFTDALETMSTVIFQKYEARLAAIEARIQNANLNHTN